MRSPASGDHTIAPDAATVTTDPGSETGITVEDVVDRHVAAAGFSAIQGNAPVRTRGYCGSRNMDSTVYACLDLPAAITDPGTLTMRLTQKGTVVNIRTLCPVALTLAIAACSSPQAPEAPQPGNDAQSSTEATPPASEPTNTPASPEEMLDASIPRRDTTPADAEVIGVRFSNSGDTETHTLGQPTTRFEPTDTVYAEVETTGTADEYNLYAKWTTSDGMVLADYGMRVTEAGPKRTVISLSKPDGWPQGTHSIEIAINGETERTVNFEVQ